MTALLYNKRKNKGDYFILISVILLSVIGTVFIYSASNYSANSTYNDSFYFVKKQIIGILLGVVCMLFFCMLDYENLKKYTFVVSGITIILMVLVFVPGIGIENYGARRWISLGFFTLQPSEIAKFSFILFSAWYIDKYKGKLKTFLGFAPILIYGLIICLLIITEPNMSITICVALLMFSVLFMSGIKIKHLIFLISPAILCAVLLVLIEPYRLKRLSAFLDPWSSPKGEGYQLLQSLYALGSGGLFGVGIFNSRQKYAFLPFAESDFILSVIGEEIGFLGLVFFFGLLYFIIFRGLKVAFNSKDVFGSVMAFGISMIFGIQVTINALVVSGSIPPTGLPLPLVSSGNTSIIIFMSEMGILYNISKSYH